jgi:hypothetical protein
MPRCASQSACHVTDKTALTANLLLSSERPPSHPHPNPFHPIPSLTHSLHPSQEDALKSRIAHEAYYTQSRIDLCASSLITLTIAGLLIIPIYLLYTLVKNSQEGGVALDRHATAVCIAILLVCTLLFSGVLTLFTRARRHEVLGAAAA